MSLNLYGNINGAHYRAPEINLFGKAKENKIEQTRFSDTIGVDKPEIKVNISGEGLRASNGEYTFVQRSEQEKADALVKGFESLYDEIRTGYAEGTRVRFVEDDTSEDGFRRISMNEEVGILKDEYVML